MVFLLQGIAILSGKITIFARQFKIRIMERITLKIRTTKSSGEIRLRFRLLDGRKADLTHKSEIKASLKDLEKFNADGTLKPKVSVFNRQLRDAISKEIEVMRQAYHRMTAEHLPVNGETFENLIDAIVNPIIAEIPEETLLARFKRFIDENFDYGVYSKERKGQYLITMQILERFLAISGQQNIKPNEFKGDDVVKFGQFVSEEYRYAQLKKWESLYSNLRRKSDIPTSIRSKNTVAAKMKMLRTLFSELEAGEEITRNPFSSTARKRIKEFLSERANVPVFLTAEEFAKLLTADNIPNNLEETYNVFMLHCSLGCRIGDFQRLSMANVSVSTEGIPYIHYLPRKTQRQVHSNKEIQTPLVRYAFDIIKRTGFNFPILKYVSGEKGYNKRIKELLRHCGIDREVPVFNEDTKQNDMIPLHDAASSKLARKTFVDMMAKVQIDVYASGLHSRGSDAVTHYTAMQLKDRFTLMNVAFGQPNYRVDKELNVID